MNYSYICGGKSFSTEAAALKYASEVYIKYKIILGVAKIEEHYENKMNLIDAVIFQIKLDMENGDLTAVEELLNLIPSKNLYSFLSDEVKEACLTAKEEMQSV
jgi:hypothetical protein